TIAGKLREPSKVRHHAGFSRAKHAADAGRTLTHRRIAQVDSEIDQIAVVVEGLPVDVTGRAHEAAEAPAAQLNAKGLAHFSHQQVEDIVAVQGAKRAKHHLDSLGRAAKTHR